jgi:hypothetical protein
VYAFLGMLSKSASLCAMFSLFPPLEWNRVNIIVVVGGSGGGVVCSKDE